MHGILVQLPLPPQIAIGEVLRTISPDKDVDGFHLYNVGGLVVGDTVFPPCTPYGVVKLLEHEGIPIEGRNVVVVGASNIVGKPMALMLMQQRRHGLHLPRQDARPRAVHDSRRHPGGRGGPAQPDRSADGQDRRGGDRRRHQPAARRPAGRRRRFQGVLPKVSHITPVPGGVGPMTVTMLLANTIGSAERSSGEARVLESVQEQQQMS